MHNMLSCVKILLVALLTASCAAYVPQATLPACTRSSSNGVCGQHGDKDPSIYEYNVYTEPLEKVPNLDACRIQCQQQTYYQSPCVSLSYTASNKTCTLFSGRVNKLGFKSRAASPTVFYNYACFNCLAQCPPASGNILVNPDFVTPTAAAPPSYDGHYQGTNMSVSPWNDEGEIYPNQNLLLVTNEGFNSPSSMRITPYGTLRQTFYACLHQVYEISFDWKVESISSQDAYFNIDVGDAYYPAPYRLLTPLYVANKDTWYHFVDSFTINALDDPNNQTSNPLTSYFELQYNGDSYNDVFFDNFLVQPVDPSSYSVVSGSKGIITNGGFESGRLGVWKNTYSKSTGQLAVRTPGNGGSQYAVGIVGSAQHGQIIQSFQPVFGKQYLFSFAYNQKGNCPGEHIDVVFTQYPYVNRDGDQNTAPSTEYQIFYDSASTNTWLTYQRPFTATGTNMTISIMINRYPVTACNPVVDDVSMKILS